MTERTHYTVPAAAQLTGLDPDFLKACIRSGQFPGYVFQPEGSTRPVYRIPTQALEAFLRGAWVPQHRTLLEVRHVETPAPLTKDDLVRKVG